MAEERKTSAQRVNRQVSCWRHSQAASFQLDFDS
jgi:hypothetical protein